jgi:hypothetical protein
MARKKKRNQRVSKFKIGQIRTFGLKGKIIASRVSKSGFVHLVQIGETTLEFKESEIK